MQDLHKFLQSNNNVSILRSSSNSKPRVVAKDTRHEDTHICKAFGTAHAIHKVLIPTSIAMQVSSIFNYGAEDLFGRTVMFDSLGNLL
nr:hypothetical protein Itr_chr06CG23540 [Ipomoea trifida]